MRRGLFWSGELVGESSKSTHLADGGASSRSHGAWSLWPTARADGIWKNALLTLTRPLERDRGGASPCGGHRANWDCARSPLVSPYDAGRGVSSRSFRRTPRVASLPTNRRYARRMSASYRSSWPRLACLLDRSQEIDQQPRVVNLELRRRPSAATALCSPTTSALMDLCRHLDDEELIDAVVATCDNPLNFAGGNYAPERPVSFAGSRYRIFFLMHLEMRLLLYHILCKSKMFTFFILDFFIIVYFLVLFSLLRGSFFGVAFFGFFFRPSWLFCLR